MLHRGEVIVEISGQEKKLEAFIDLMRPFGIIELARTGRIAMVRGNNKIEEAPASGFDPNVSDEDCANRLRKQREKE